uniref:Uncharacterized protein n=1 Tax=Anguilla anguilla TaxID=7936 RepID=A0A0E9WSH1_ANGAN
MMYGCCSSKIATSSSFAPSPCGRMTSYKSFLIRSSFVFSAVIRPNISMLISFFS